MLFEQNKIADYVIMQWGLPSFHWQSRPLTGFWVMIPKNFPGTMVEPFLNQKNTGPWGTHCPVVRLLVSLEGPSDGAKKKCSPSGGLLDKGKFDSSLPKNILLVKIGNQIRILMDHTSNTSCRRIEGCKIKQTSVVAKAKQYDVGANCCPAWEPLTTHQSSRLFLQDEFSKTRVLSLASQIIEVFSLKRSSKHPFWIPLHSLFRSFES